MATRTFTHLLVEHDGFMDRLRGTGRLESETVRALGGVGPAARASGVDTDLRRDRPYAAYADLRHALHVPIHQDGDVEARLRQRLAEAIVSFRLLEELLANPPDGPVRIPLGPLQPHRLGLGAWSRREVPTCMPSCLMATGASLAIACAPLRFQTGHSCRWPYRAT